MNTSPLPLKEHWNYLKEDNPAIRTKQAADKLGDSEAQLLAFTYYETSLDRLSFDHCSI